MQNGFEILGLDFKVSFVCFCLYVCMYVCFKYLTDITNVETKLLY